MVTTELRKVTILLTPIAIAAKTPTVSLALLEEIGDLAQAYCDGNKLQKLEDALVEQMLTSAKCAKDVKNAQKCAKGVRFSKIVQNVQKWAKCAKLCKICKVVQNVQTVQSCAKCA